MGSEIRARAMDGNIKLELTYDNPLPSHAWAFVISEYHATIKVINKLHNFITVFICDFYFQVTHNRAVSYEYFS